MTFTEEIRNKKRCAVYQTSNMEFFSENSQPIEVAP